MVKKVHAIEEKRKEREELTLLSDELEKERQAYLHNVDDLSKDSHQVISIGFQNGVPKLFALYGEFDFPRLVGMLYLSMTSAERGMLEYFGASDEE